jgi:hypothetical protein
MTQIANINQGTALFSKGLSTDFNSSVYQLGFAQINEMNYIGFTLRLGSTTNVYRPVLFPVPLNTLTNITATYNGQIMKIFINGIEQGDGTIVSGNIETNTQELILGVRHIHRGTTNVATSFLQGDIYIAQVYNTGLSGMEVIQNYNGMRGRFGI